MNKSKSIFSVLCITFVLMPNAVNSEVSGIEMKSKQGKLLLTFLQFFNYSKEYILHWLDSFENVG